MGGWGFCWQLCATVSYSTPDAPTWALGPRVLIGAGTKDDHVVEKRGQQSLRPRLYTEACAFRLPWPAFELERAIISELCIFVYEVDIHECDYFYTGRVRASVAGS